MNNSLPGISSIEVVECDKLQPSLMLRAMSNLPNTIFAETRKLTNIYDAVCSTETIFINGSKKQKTSLTFVTIEQIEVDTPLAFVVKCVNGDMWLIGKREAPYPAVKTVHNTGNPKSDTHTYKVDVTLSDNLTLLPLNF